MGPALAVVVGVMCCCCLVFCLKALRDKKKGKGKDGDGKDDGGGGDAPTPRHGPKKFRRRGCTDVAPRYAADWRATLGRRTWVKEGWLELTISTLNASRGVADHDAAAAADRAQLAELTKPAEEGAAAAAGGGGGDKETEARGRQTGSIEWRRARGETRE